MRTAFKILFKIVAFPIALIWCATKPRHFPHGRPFKVRMPLIIDGDTFWHQGRRYRIWGIDAPEMGEANGAAAKQHLERLANQRDLNIIPRDTDVYGRVVVQVFCGRRDIGEAMVEDGFALSRNNAYPFQAVRAAKKKRGLLRYGPISDPAAYRSRAAQKKLNPSVDFH